MLALSALAPEIELLHFLAERQSSYCLIFFRNLCASIANVAETGVFTTSPEAFELLFKKKEHCNHVFCALRAFLARGV
jgi:hypothetical protein